MQKILNNYAGIGGNRKKWKDCQVTAVEINPQVAAVYQKLFPDDIVIVGDAHEYLLQHFQEFDFIWSSPPCQTHSRFNLVREPRYVDMSLYQEIVLLDNHFNGQWVVENVRPYYGELFASLPQYPVERHIFYANFRIGKFEMEKPAGSVMVDWSLSDLQKWLGIYIDEKLSLREDGTHTEQVYRNCVHPDVGEYILNCARGIVKSTQPTLF